MESKKNILRLKSKLSYRSTVNHRVHWFNGGAVKDKLGNCFFLRR